MRNIKKIKHPFLLIFSVCFLSFLMVSCGSVPQTISKDTYKVYKKQAKSGNSAAMLKIANAFKGDMFTSNELRDYENAIKWYSQAVAASSKQKIPAARELFKIYMTGSEDVPRNIDAAKKWLQVVADSMDLHMYYQDNTDLYLLDIFDVYKGDKLPAGKKSYALSFILRDDEKTLTDVVIEGTMNRFVALFEREVGAKLR